jgi:aspartate aminotransferase
MQRVVAGLQTVSIDVDLYRRRRDGLYRMLTELGFRMVKPQGGFFIFPETPVENDVDFVRAALAHHILVVPGTGFGRPGHFRIAYSVPLEMIERSKAAWHSLAESFGMV